VREDNARTEGYHAVALPPVGSTSCRGARTASGPPAADLTSRRRAAKIGMAVSLGVLVYSGLRGREVRGVHVAAGLAFLGFSFWHLGLYPSGRPGRRGTP